MTSARGLALSPAQRMIDRVHGNAADVRPPAEPPAATRLANRHVLVVEVAHLSDRREALDVDLPDFSGGHFHRRILAFLGHHLDGGSGAAGDLTALARFH